MALKSLHVWNVVELKGLLDLNVKMLCFHGVYGVLSDYLFNDVGTWLEACRVPQNRHLNGASKAPTN